MDDLSARRVDKEDLEGVLAAFVRWPYRPFYDLRIVPEDVQASLLRSELADLLARPGVVATGVRTGDEWKDILVATPLELDSRLFGFPCVNLAFAIHGHPERMGESPERAASLGEMLNVLRSQRCRFLGGRFNALDASALWTAQTLGFRYLDTTVRYAFEYGRTAVPAYEPAVDVRPGTTDDISALTEIAATYVENRFHYDSGFPRNESDEMYRVWIRNSLSSKDTHVVVPVSDGRPVGFTTMRYHPEVTEAGGPRVGEMVFSAVDPSARGRDIYTTMIHAGLQHFEGSAEVVYLGTLVNNIAVQRAWQRLGFRLVSAACGFHYWL